MGCKLLTCYTISHFISEHEQNFKGKGATGRSVFKVLLIQVGLLFKEKARIMILFRSLNSSLTRKDSDVIKPKVSQK